MSALDDTLRLLANQQRRDLLRSLSDGPCRVAAAADDSAERVSLHHIHLPKLAEAGVVDWSPDADVVERGAEFERVAPLLETIDEMGDR
jgi:predicted transcriptional regulator